MSTQQEVATVWTDAESISSAIARLPAPFTLLPAGTAQLSAPVNTNRNWVSGFGKRVLDISIALPLVVLLAPLLLLIAFLVRLESQGPAFFRQQRNGICGRSFRILKFRTMHVMEDGASVMQACDGDPRITRAGRFLRRYSLDELPQLLNVVLGDMSLVGPRPHALAHDVYYGAVIPDYRHRYAVKPGITGWAQIHGHRGPTPTVESMAQRVDYDVFYVRRADLLLDLKILLRTPLEILRPRNAV